jgi:hypothetical protein
MIVTGIEERNKTDCEFPEAGVSDDEIGAALGLISYIMYSLRR